MKEKDLDEIIKRMEKKIDDMGKREDFEKFKKEREGKSLEDLLDELKELIAKGISEIIKPEFKIVMETHKDEEGYHISIQGTRASLMVALSELAGNLVEKSNLTKEDILMAINKGLGEAEEE